MTGENETSVSDLTPLPNSVRLRRDQTDVSFGSKERFGGLPGRPSKFPTLIDQSFERCEPDGVLTRAVATNVMWRPTVARGLTPRVRRADAT